ncbi:proprotein convertase P-domain-containing protein [Paraliomyxa miuraensis]|uniref:proprotein convertase P-domain-containing protein n=1 Tax=Paraliomyxa miuraensis TaxID=376150 RepID=UPI002257A267|nr:proprotein convertase P-domain-containing protein [Paraliomyxa miuraensis]MCX4243057.1 proprotein convertase P-domain-containing protein [Paraliomyxa miuraensis]
MLDWRHFGVLLLSALIGGGSGCGTIVELPVGDVSTGTTADEDGITTSSGTEQPDGTSNPGTSSQDTGEVDIDMLTSSGPTEDSTSTGEMLVSIPICGDPLLEIPEDGTWAAAAIEVPAHAGVLDLDVAIRIQHPEVSELRVRMRAPDGTVVSLLDTPTCSGAGLEAIFDDDAGQSAEEACTEPGLAAIYGNVEPLDALAPLLAAPVVGTWIVEVTDVSPQQAGSIDQACITLTVEGP